MGWANSGSERSTAAGSMRVDASTENLGAPPRISATM